MATELPHEQITPKPEINWEQVNRWLVSRDKPSPIKQIHFLLNHAMDVADAIDDHNASRVDTHEKPLWRKVLSATVPQDPRREWVAKWTIDNYAAAELMANRSNKYAKFDYDYLVEDTKAIGFPEDSPLQLLEQIGRRHSLHYTTRHALVAGRLLFRECLASYVEPPQELTLPNEIESAA